MSKRQFFPRNDHPGVVFFPGFVVFVVVVGLGLGVKF